MIQIPSPLLQAVLVPIAFAPISYLAGRKVGERAGWVAFAPLAYSTLLLLIIGSGILLTGELRYEEAYVWVPDDALLRFGLLADGLSWPIAFTVSLLCASLAVYSMPYVRRRVEEEYGFPNYHAQGAYYALYPLFAAGMMGTVLATNLIEFFLFFELMLWPSWALINSYGYGERERIGMMYFLWTHAGAASLFVGLIVASIGMGSFEVADLAALRGDPVAPWVAFAMLLGFLVKMAAFGLHIWLPYAHAEAPTPISALLSPAMIGIGAYAATRLVLIPFDFIEQAGVAIAAWALITMVYGAFMALNQDDIKRFLAYSSISQMGLLLLGISYATTLSTSGAMFHYVSHGLGKAILFAAAGVLIYQAHGIRSLARLGGLAGRMPITATSFIIGGLTIAGVPPTVGFQSKIMLFSGVLSASFGSAGQSPSVMLIAVLSLIATAFTLAYVLWAIRRVFFGPLPEHLEGVREAPPAMSVPMLIFAILSIVLGIYPRAIADFLIPFIGQLIGV